MNKPYVSPLIRINTEARLYVVQCGAGFTCCGFDYADKLLRGVSAWLGRDYTHPDLVLGTKPHFQAYEFAMRAGALHHADTGARCDIELTPQLLKYEGKRVEVTDRYGQTRRFIVGKSTGWMPCHLEIARRTSHGGMAVYGAPFPSVRLIGPGR